MSKKVNVQVNQAPNPKIVGKQTFCADEEVQLSTIGHPSVTVNWLIDSSIVATNVSKISEDLAPGSYLVRLDATSTTSGCPSINPPFPVTVLAALPKPALSSTNGYPLCEGSPIQLNASPAGGNFYWNTGQTGSSITQTLDGEYTVYQTDISGCVASGSIEINPLPDFSNFMTGCYCIPFGNTPDLLGISNMGSYQWLKNGGNVPSPTGQLQNIPASTGSFQLAVVSDSGCVDTSGVIDVTVGGCEPCILSLSDFNIDCSQVIGDSTFYSFSLTADIDNIFAYYSLSQNISINGQPASSSLLQPDSITGTGNAVSGTFVVSNAQVGDSICIQLTANNPAVNCTASLCTVIKPIACNFVPAISYSINPYSCEVSLSANALFNSCVLTDSVLFNWTVNQNGVYTSTGESFILTELEQGEAIVCLQMQVFNSSDSSFCVKDTCITIVVPDCSCNDNCAAVSATSATFQRFIQRNDSCIAEIKIVIANPQNIVVFPNLLQTQAGSIIGFTPTASAPNTVAYIIEYYQAQPAQCGEVCFELFLNTGGTDCCLNVCVNLPTCSCNLELEELQVLCSNDPNNPNLYDFTFLANLDACNGFTYEISEIKAILENINVDLTSVNANTLTNGTNSISGQIDVGTVKGSEICFTLEASFGGISCTNTICMALPEPKCETEVLFTSEFDPVACKLTLNNESSLSPCSRLVDKKPLKWKLSYDGITEVQFGETVIFME